MEPRKSFVRRDPDDQRIASPSDPRNLFHDSDEKSRVYAREKESSGFTKGVFNRFVKLRKTARNSSVNFHAVNAKLRHLIRRSPSESHHLFEHSVGGSFENSDLNCSTISPLEIESYQSDPVVNVL